MKSAFREKEVFVIPEGALYLSERHVRNSTILCTHLSISVANAERRVLLIATTCSHLLSYINISKIFMMAPVVDVQFGPKLQL
jgi:hypothetical protein